MHESALEFGRAFFDAYLPAGQAVILDLGSQDVNGTLRECAPLAATYVGVDMVAGEGVDLVLEDPHVLPFAAQHFDAVVATSCFEHDPMFWVTFLEIVRVTRSGGHIYVNAPSNGWYHQYPRDNWRFYPDAGLSLQAWARREGFEVALIESFIGRRRHNVWNDCVMVFRRGPESAIHSRISDRFPNVMNLRRGDTETPVVNYAKETEDIQIIQNLMQDIALRDIRIANLDRLVKVYEDMFEQMESSPDRTSSETPLDHT